MCHMKSRARICRFTQIEQTSAGRPLCPVGPGVFARRAWREIARSLRLSRRELEILRGVFGSRKRRAIATDLHISEHTVREHVRRLHVKLQALDDVQLVLRVVEEFLRLTVSPTGTLPAVCAAGWCPLDRWFPRPSCQKKHGSSPR